MILRRCNSNRRGVTMIEVILSMGILVVVTSMAFWFYSSALTTSRSGTKAAERLRLSRVVLDRLATEVRQSLASTVDKKTGVRGEPERIILSTYRVPTRQRMVFRNLSDNRDPGQYDVAQVEYKIVRHPDILHDDGWALPLGLARVERLIPRALAPPGQSARGRAAGQDVIDDGGDQFADDPTADAAREAEGLSEGDDQGGAGLAPEINWDELYAPQIHYLRFCYYDGHRWWDKWEVTGANPLPQLVQITIGYSDHPAIDDVSGDDQINEEFCTCLSEDPVDCKPLGKDQYSTVVRVPQADPLFRSRVGRETQALTEDANVDPAEEGEGGEPQ